LNKIKDKGVAISIDDFGTGYSSLSYLQRFPVDNLKIDSSFIREIAANPEDGSIVAAIISMAQTMKLKTIAEGIENEGQVNILRILRCDMVQGHYYCEPLAAGEVEKLFGP
jgi:EAL domain-containing protein (putative c-di-GMP-specific phosphodiesterase class I)